METNKKFGLIGKDISYSFSKKYFTEKFSKELFDDCTYENFDIPTIEEFPNVLKNNPDLKGLNITIPYKEEIIPYLDELSKTAKKIGAVNCITISKKKKLKGYNTDYHGFKKSIQRAYPDGYNRLLDRIFDEHGLIICGWSGEWDHALREAFLRAPNRRYPVYWAARGTLGSGAQQLATHRAARAIPINGADEFFQSLQQRVETLEQSQRQQPSERRVAGQQCQTLSSQA